MQTIPAPAVVRKLLPLTPSQVEQIRAWRQTIADILLKKDKRLLLIIGPCAIHRADSALAYAERLAQLSEALSEYFFVIFRAYIEKSRSQSGWKGFLYCQRDGEKKSSLTQGIIESRALFLKFLALGLPVGMEFLEPLAADYFSDLVSWGTIGAKTVLSTTHRELASRLPMPVGLKNSPDGSIEGAIDSIMAAQKPHTIFGISEAGHLGQIQTRGNPYAHLVLRGGMFEPNYSDEHIHYATKLLHLSGLNPSIIVDCSHDNSQKRYERQPLVFFEILEGILTKKTPSISGMMVESFLLASSQDELLRNASSEEERESILYGASKVDGCLGWETTELFLKEACDRCRQNYETFPQGS